MPEWTSSSEYQLQPIQHRPIRVYLAISDQKQEARIALKWFIVPEYNAKRFEADPPFMYSHVITHHGQKIRMLSLYLPLSHVQVAGVHFGHAQDTKSQSL